MADPKQAEHNRKLEWSKVNFAYLLVVAAAFTGVGLATYGHYHQGITDSTLLPSAVDLCKLLATTALGFVFGAKNERG